MLGFSWEHLIILGIVLVVFGPKRLPELGNSLGKAVKNFKDGLAGVENAKFRNLNSTERQPTTDTALHQEPDNKDKKETV